MASGGSIYVDVAGLKGLASKMRMVQGALTSDTGMFSDGANGVEHPVLRRSLNEFEERWSKKRHHIHEALGTVAKAFDTAAEAFDEADKELAGVLKPDAGLPWFKNSLTFQPVPVRFEGPITDRLDQGGGSR